MRRLSIVIGRPAAIVSNCIQSGTFTSRVVYTALYKDCTLRFVFSEIWWWESAYAVIVHLSSLTANITVLLKASFSNIICGSLRTFVTYWLLSIRESSLVLMHTPLHCPELPDCLSTNFRIQCPGHCLGKTLRWVPEVPNTSWSLYYVTRAHGIGIVTFW